MEQEKKDAQKRLLEQEKLVIKAKKKRTHRRTKT